MSHLNQRALGGGGSFGASGVSGVSSVPKAPVEPDEPAEAHADCETCAELDQWMDKIIVISIPLSSG